ncbi:MAG TPA: phosphoribosylformylglycinamidine synthase subunit PurL [Candidatus Dormibacteraeota bacterium]|nr:phosphoribosylformylglycinamidine synthase subunit PurL [Candidatus Dormibacteraeota bacterium]
MRPTPVPLTPTAAELRELALTELEYQAATVQLDRAPNPLELGMLGALWSEHCSYKTSKALLRQLPQHGERVVQGPGENAGVVDLGEDLLCCFKIESHNHPSAVEPVQGAATGVGGILRDVFAMGARPVALLDAIRVGDLGDPGQRQRFARVVEGIGWYGNCIGVPTVGGETYFDQAYQHNCLVNAMCVGLARRDQLVRARASGPGNPLLLVGADTGRDGIHGATFASVELDHSAEERRPAVQVGNPFLEKCLLEACLELTGDPDLIGLQDCGAAGLTSSCAEMAHRGGVGLEIEVDQVSRREQGMTPYEVMLSESQERMVLVVRRGSEDRFRAAFQRWGLHSDVVGRVIEEPLFRITAGGDEVASLPLQVLVSGFPERHPEARAPEVAAALAADPLARNPPWSAEAAWLMLLASPNCGDSHWIWRQYDHQVGDDTVLGPGGDAAVLRLRGRPDALALTVDSAHRSAAVNPRQATAIAVAEALRNLACVGAEPLGITNCLNFGDPDQPEIMWQLQEAVGGLADAARALGVPVVSGNVSLYNQFDGQGIPPTPTLGVVGLLPELSRRLGAGFTKAGDLVALVGPAGAGPAGVELGGSEYQRLAHGVLEGLAPEVDLQLEGRTAAAMRAAIHQGLLSSAHDCSLGGLAVALAESALLGGIGARIKPPLSLPDRPAPSWRMGLLFGESQGRYLVSLRPAQRDAVTTHFGKHRTPWAILGRVGGSTIAVEGVAEIAWEAAQSAWRSALPSRLEPAGAPGS